jgi:RecJ-like exonuclease
MEEKGLKKSIEEVSRIFLEKIKDQEVFIVSHFDTDGITSAAIMIKTLRNIDRKFSLKILKSLEEEFIKEIPKDKIILFLDLASGSINHLEKSSLNLENIFIIDHHQIPREIPDKINIINPELWEGEKISASGLTYLFCKKLDPSNKELAKLAVLGMIGDCLEKEIDKLNNGILEEGEVQRKRGLLIYPSTRPLNRVLEYSSYPFIPGVTGDMEGVLNLLRESSISMKNNKYPSLIELSENEMSKIVTGIMLRNPRAKVEEIIGDIFLIKMFNKLEDAREISATINACSRLGRSDIALQFCMEIPKVKKESEAIHIRYKQHLISGLKFVNETEKIQGKGFVIINAKDKIRDTIVGTITSILSNSAIYEPGTIITTMAYYDDKIKVSSRNVGRSGRNLREILSDITERIGGEVGGHHSAAGCIIYKDKEKEFLDCLKKALEIEVIKI